MAIYTVRSGNLYQIEKMLRRLQNAAKRNGWPSPSMKLLTKVYATAQYQSVADIEISVPVFELGGWTVVGERTHSGHFIEYTREKHADNFKAQKFACQHCGKLRKRNTVFALEHDGGERKLVGSSCIDEFTGVLNAESFAMFLQKVFAFAESIVEAQRLNLVERAQIIPTGVASIVTCAAIRTFGFVDGHNADATHKRVLQYLETGECDGLEIADEDVAASGKLIDKVGGENSVVFVAALPLTVKQINQNLRAQAQEAAPSQWVGALGDKLTLSVKFVEGRKLVGAQWDSWLYKGYVGSDMITVFSSKELPIVINAVTQIHGNVKKHDEYKGVKSTVLNYVKVF